MRGIKFRCWDGRKMYFWGFTEYGFDGPPSSGNGSFMSMVQMQYTGLKDKAGVEIYEGDIVRQCYKNSVCEYIIDVGQIEWFHDLTGFAMRCKNSVSSFMVRNNGGQRFYVEIIGNIWENPELLEAKR